MGMIKANLDPSFEINEKSKYQYHVRCERKTLVPGSMEFDKRTWTASFKTKVEYEQFKKYQKAAHVHGSKLIHDPNKQIENDKAAARMAEARKAKKGANKSADGTGSGTTKSK